MLQFLNRVVTQATSIWKLGQASSRNLKTRSARAVYGQITKVIPGTCVMTASVPADGRPEVRCLYAPSVMAPLFGVKSCELPVEGTTVLLIVLPDDPETYVAVCSVPESTQGYLNLPQIGNAAIYGSSPEPGANYWNVDSYRKASEDSSKLSFVPSPAERPFSMLPGEWAKANTMGCLVGLFQFMSTLKSTERAKLECFVFDDLVRLTSGQFQHISAFGSTEIYDDCGHVNWELGGSHYTPEVRGYKDFKKMAVDKVTGKTAAEERWAAENYDAAGKKRFHLMMGALGDMLQLYLRNGQDSLDPELMSSHLDYSAFFKMHLDNSGAMTMQSSSGIGFELNDRIPIPKRLKDPWDPSGDKVAGDTFKPKMHYKYNDETAAKLPWMRNLRAIDADLWERGLAYQRYDELSKDFYVPQESAISVPSDIYDKEGSTTQHSKYPGRRGGFKVDEDGSVRIWDSFGGEIFMRGGDIVLSCPGHVILQPGKGVVALANNIILKAKTGVDITAEDKDVTVVGQNLRFKGRRFMIMEAGSMMVMRCRYMLAQAEESIHMVAKRLAAKIEDVVQVVANAMYLIGGDRIVAETDGKASLMVSGDSAFLVGSTVSVAGDKNVMITKDRDMMVPLMWQPIRTSMYDSLSELSRRLDDLYGNEETWFEPFRQSERDSDDYKVRFRSSDEFGCSAGIETYMAAPKFKLYQTRWQMLNKIGCGFISASTSEWREEPVDGTYPWPGASARAAAYATMPVPANTEDGTVSKARSSLSGEFSGSVAAESMDKYIIVQ